MKAKAKLLEKNIEIEEQYDIHVNCSVEGNPKPVIQWEKVGENLPGNHHFEKDKQILVIEKARLHNSGKYKCTAQNYLQISTAVANVVIKKRLSLYQKSTHVVRTFIGQDVQIYCLYEHGVEPVIVEWHKDGKTLPKKAELSRNNQWLLIRSIEKQDVGEYKCIIKSKFSQIFGVTRIDLPPRTCGDERKGGTTKSGHYTLYLHNLPPVQVYCDMESKNKVGVTVISHDSEARTLVQGIEANGGYKKTITYSLSKAHLQALVKLSNKCEQYIKYECKDSVISQYGWWTSVKGQKMTNFGDVNHSQSGCSCHLTNSCAGKHKCNCDMNDNVWREDSGILKEKEFLPVSEVRFGDTGDPGEMGYYTVGKLMCY